MPKKIDDPYLKMQAREEVASDYSKGIENRTAIISLVKILQHYGVKNVQKILKKHENVFDFELEWRELRGIAQKYRIKGAMIRPTIDELREVEYPAIAKMNDGAFVTIGSANDEVVLMLDPRQKKPTAMSVKQFVEAWSNEMMTFTPSLSWAFIKKKYNLDFFFMVFKRYKKSLFEVLVGTFFLQLMGIGMPLITQVIIDKVIGNQGMSTLMVIGWSMVVFFLMQGLISLMKTYLLNHVVNKLDAILGTRMFRHLVALPVPYYERRRVGDTILRVRALTMIRKFLTDMGISVFLDVLFSFVGIAFMLWYSVPLTLISLLIVPLYVIQNIWVYPLVMSKASAIWRTLAMNNSFLIESINNVETVKALAVEPQFNYKWENLVARNIRANFEKTKLQLLLSAFNSCVQGVLSMAILWFGGHMVMNGEFTLGQLIAFQMISRQALTPLTTLLTMWPRVIMAGMALERIGDILNAGAEPLAKELGARGPARVDGAISFTDVSFRYRIDLPLVLKNINLEVGPGEKVGIVGRSGSGKSTLTNLVQHLYAPESGDVVIGGVKTRDANLAWLREQIGVVRQENYLFNASVRDNIAISKPTATMDEIIRAARLAGAHDFILELKEGYDTKVGERGDALSGGQRQRVAIARALLENPPILIFDEATSALDYESERIILNNMEAIGARRTMLIIAHRLSAVRKCNKIIVIDKGEIVEQGTHDELLKRDGMYRYLYNQQEGK